ncbi:MAG TPA: methyltransferase domain-containing protein [Spirochaetota bacterium]|nr:methyltransferase domain-containing protein [Spirochaetota bacterium]HPF04414.1 methyltransferase domain-containing protein [Spirochaetota bacterium]HPJ40814.1 methyltransferase domain-containing protein [Spirochaetota bacterium]HPR36083.1 methyltransferase domain-containing protein [Spirochaetota bacterium]HRX45997.1 methyltransferase domain-containing protein [Spirochaetota bacterium]
MNNNRDIIIRIDNVVYGGYGLGRLDGKIIFIESAIPGDVLKITLKEEYKDYSTAVIDKIIEPSTQRVKPDCPVADLCGGCTYLSVSYNTELEFKRSIIRDQLKRVANIQEENLPEIETVSDKRYGYRSHTRFNTGHGIKGFFKKGTNEIVEFPDQGCLLLSEELNREIKKLEKTDIKTEIRAASDTEGSVIFGKDNLSAEIIESANGLYYHREINGFFQANRFLRDKMIQQVIDLSSTDKNSTFLDICSGCGFFTLPMAQISKYGHGFDIDSGSINYAKKNSKINRIKNVSFYKLAESEIKPHLYNPDVVIIDPPRSGLSKKGRRTVNAINPPCIVYVSCNPSTFARDLRDLIKNGYKLNKLIFIDMFPCTYHIEIISQLVKL